MEKLKEFEVDLASMTDGHYEYDFKIDKSFFEAMDNEEILGADVDALLDIDKRHGSYELRLHCDGELEVPCDRCLDPVKHPVDADYDVTVRYGEDYDDSRDGVLILPESENRLNVSGMIYDTLLLTIPLRCVHAPGECNADMARALREHQSGEEDDTEA